MKLLRILAMLLPSMVITQVQAVCLDAKPNQSYTGHFLYMGANHWLLEVDQRLLELKNDKVVSVATYPDYLKIMCGQRGQILATTKTKVFEWNRGKLKELPITVKGDVSSSDGEVVYSLDHSLNKVALYSNKKGLSTKIVEQEGASGTQSNGTFVWSHYDTLSNWVLRQGKVVARYPIPEEASLTRVFDYDRCQGKGLFNAQNTFITKSSYGLQRKTIDSLIANVDYAKGCEEYLFLLNDVTYTKGQLWSLKPGKELTFTPIPTSCPVDHFASNADGSMYYRCGNQFYYKNRARTKDVFLGAATKLQLTSSASDGWLDSTMDGTLFSLTQYQNSKQPQTCFVRLMPTRLVDIGCY